jgi:hypothetical protein
MIDKCTLISLPKITDTRGNLTFIEGLRHIPFEISRVYYLYDVPEKCQRGGHAHKALHQLIIAVSGSFDVHLSDGKNTKIFHLDSPIIGLYVCPMIWRELCNFSENSICLVLASNYYDEDDYYRDYDQFKNVSMSSK